MLRTVVVLGFVIVIINQAEIGICQNVPASWSRGHASPVFCSPQQPHQAKAVARTVQVTVPLPRPAPPVCGPIPSLCPPVPYRPKDTRSMPVRVEVAVRPEGFEQRNPVPVVYRDPGFLGPMIRHGVGLVGATVSAPFRVAEMLVPVGCAPPAEACRPAPP